MTLWVCTGCTTKYAVGLSRCPRCHGTDFVEDGQPMPKNTVDTGVSHDGAEPGQPGYVEEPAPEPAAVLKADEDQDDAEAADGEEESSPGNSSETSPEKQPPTSPTTDSESPPPAPTTANPSKKGRAGSGHAGSTAGSTRGTGSSRPGS